MAKYVSYNKVSLNRGSFSWYLLLISGVKNIFRYSENFAVQTFFVSSFFFFIYFTISGVKIIVRYNEDVFKERFQYRGSSVHTIHYHEAFSFNKILAKSKWIPFKWKRLPSASGCSGSSVSLYVLLSKINFFSFCYPFQWSANFCS